MSKPARPLPVAVCGDGGAWGRAAARRYFGGTTGALSCAGADAAVRAVLDNRASHAILPVENTLAGIFSGVAEAFREAEVAIVGEVFVPSRPALLGLPGSRLDELERVHLHPITLTQCRAWLAGVELQPTTTEDTSRAARELARGEDRTLAVIGSRELAADHGLEVLAEGIADAEHNVTRFLVVSRAAERTREGSRCALEVGPVPSVRTLKTLRIQLESLGASRVRAPLAQTADGRSFLVEFDHRGGRPDLAVDEACVALPHRFLGAWSPRRAS